MPFYEIGTYNVAWRLCGSHFKVRAEIYNLPVLQNRHILATLEMYGRRLARGEFICKRARKEENKRLWNSA